MRTLLYCAVTALMLLASAPPADAALSTGYVSKVRVVSWIPIREADLESAIAAQAVAALSRDGLLRLEKGTRGKKLDMKLFVGGEVVEDAGNFTVTLSIRPLRDPGLPSFVTAATVSISGQKRAVMFKRIISAARTAARRMSAAMRAHPEILARLGSAGATGGPLPAMFQWGKVAPLPVKATSKDLATFLNGRLSWHKRKEAAFRISGLAYDNANVRHAVEKVALTDPDPITRLYAVKFLRPSARAHRFTQQVLLAVAREDADPKVKGEALTLSHSFMGLSKRETLQTWVQLLASRVADLNNRSFKLLTKSLGWRPNTPNLDLGLLRCLRQQEVLREGRDRKELCLDLVEQLPPRRRGAILLGYLGQPFDALSNDLPRRRGDGPVMEAVEIALRRPCDIKRIRGAIWRLLKEVQNPEAEATLLQALAEQQYTPAVVRAVSQRLSRASDRSTSYKLKSLLERVARGHRPDWNVTAWATARKEVSRLMGSSDERLDRDLKRLLERLDKLRQQPHKAGLRRHLRAEGSPRASAVDYLRKCVEDAGDDRAGGDCAEALGWIALSHASLRTRALEALDALQRQGVGRRAQSRVRSALHTLKRALEPRRDTWRRSRNEVCR